jgi:DNA-binding transcriptional LysR family regulator
MTETEPGWDLFGAFLAVMRGGSLSAAARSLGVAQPTVRRQIEALEAQLGVVLFTRGPNGLVPTELATGTLPHAEALAASARAIVRSLSGGTDPDRGTVRIACSEIVGVEVLPPMLAVLSVAHPQLQLELSLSNRNEDLLRRDADVAVRMVRPTQQGLVTRRVGAIPLGFFATEDYLARRGTPATLSDLLEGHALVGADRTRDLIDALEHLGLSTRPRDFTLRSDSDLAQLAAVRAGLGIGVAQVPIAARDPRLRRVVPALTLPLETWVVMHEDLRGVPRIRRVFDHLAEHLGHYAAAPAPVPEPKARAPRRR